MQHSNKNEHKNDENITCTYEDNVVQVTFYASYLGSSYVVWV